MKRTKMMPWDNYYWFAAGAAAGLLFFTEGALDQRVFVILKLILTLFVVDFLGTSFHKWRQHRKERRDVS